LRLRPIGSVCLVIILGCASGRAAWRTADGALLVAPLPACFLLRFDSGVRPETDMGILPDSITLTPPFSSDGRESDGYVYAGALPESRLPRSRAEARSFGGHIVSWWIGTRDSLVLSAPGQLRAVSLHLGAALRGMWRETHDMGERRTGTFEASRIACPRS
jgi:hypothetical protein